jgi:hypothetical protein
MDINRLDDQITTVVDMNGSLEAAFVSVTVDAMAMTPDQSYLPSKAVVSWFVIYGQPLDWRLKYFPLPVITADSGQANEKVCQAMDAVCDGLTGREFVVKHTCTDRDPQDGLR